MGGEGPRLQARALLAALDKTILPGLTTSASGWFFL
jgi:hypothetical protein